jgi:hypothetical protein
LALEAYFQNNFVAMRRYLQVIILEKLLHVFVQASALLTAGFEVL